MRTREFILMLGMVASGVLEPAEGVTVVLSNPALPPPVVFSGTNCYCAGQVVADPGCYVTSATLTVEGAPVATYSWQQGQTRYGQVILSCNFASTHFNPGTLALILSGSDSSGDSKSSHRHEVPPNQQDRVYNFSRVYVLDSLEDVFPHANRIQHALTLPGTGMRHEGILKYHDDWPKSTVLQSIPEGTAFHVTTHGGNNWQSFFRASDWNPVFSGEIGQQVDQKANHTPWPYPPYNIVFVNACESSLGNDMTTMGFKILIGSTDRAFLGWWAPVPSYNGTRFAPAFWEALNDGKNVVEARAAGYEAAGWEPDHPGVEAHISGDEFATLDPNRVYTGDQPPAPNGWYIPHVDLQEPLP